MVGGNYFQIWKSEYPLSWLTVFDKTSHENNTYDIISLCGYVEGLNFQENLGTQETPQESLGMSCITFAGGYRIKNSTGKASRSLKSENKKANNTSKIKHRKHGTEDEVAMTKAPIAIKISLEKLKSNNEWR